MVVVVGLCVVVVGGDPQMASPATPPTVDSDTCHSITPGSPTKNLITSSPNRNATPPYIDTSPIHIPSSKKISNDSSLSFVSATDTKSVGLTDDNTMITVNNLSGTPNTSEIHNTPLIENSVVSDPEILRAPDSESNTQNFSLLQYLH